MLTKTAQQELQALFAADRAISVMLSGAQLPIPKAYYRQLVDWMMEHTKILKCSSQTSYLAKLYLDGYLLGQPAVPTEQLHLLGVTCIKLGVKFNESFDYKMAEAQASTYNKYTAQEFLDAQESVLLALKFELNISTPFSYIKIVKELLPQLNPNVFQLLEMMVEYVSMLPELVQCSSGEVLFAVLLYLCKLCKVTHVRAIVFALAARYPNVEQTAAWIENRHTQDSASQPTDNEVVQMDIEG